MFYLRQCPLFVTQLLFVLIDCCIALLFRRIALYNAPLIGKIVNPPYVLQHLPDVVMAFYLFNPFTIMSCVALNLTIFTHLGIAASIAFAMQGMMFTSAFSIACAIYLDVYPIMLLPAIAILLHDRSHPLSDYSLREAQELVVDETKSAGEEEEEEDTSVYLLGVTVRPGEKLTFLTAPAWGVGEYLRFAALPVLCVAAWVLALLWLSFLFLKDWTFLEHSYGFTFMVWDLRPSVGVFWYFFTAIFIRFRTFFLLIFHSHMLFYVPPLVIRYRTEPLFLASVIVGIFSVFKSYSVIADSAFAVTFLLTNFVVLVPKMRRMHAVVYVFAQSCVIGNLMWFLWIYPGSGNANFVYFQSLAYIFCLLFGLVESLTAVRKLKAVEHQIEEMPKRLPDQGVCTIS